MEKFLKNVVDYLYRKYNNELSELCIVFPGRRAIVFFNRYLSEVTDKPLWAPTFLSINELMQKTAKAQVTDKLSLVFELYKTYIKERKSNESFDHFHQWGEMLLNDFDNIDKYLVPAETLFQNISSLKDIDKQFNYLSEEQIDAIKQFWENFDPQKTSDHKARFIEIWKVLFDIYSSFKKELHTKNMAYEGMIYRDIAEKIEQNKLEETPYKKYIFIGFNALNNCEEALFKQLKKQDKAEFFWDYDKFYLNKKYHEAGFFLRKNIQLFPAPVDFSFSEDKMNDPNKKISIISTPSDVSQAKIVNQLIEQQKSETTKDYTNFAIVLADESLLFPVIHSLPDDIKNINITMGYPLKATAVSSLLDNLLLLQKNAREKDGKSLFHHNDVISVISHQYIRQQNPEKYKKYRDSIIKDNVIFVHEDFFKNDEFFSNILKKVTDHIEFSSYLINVLSNLFDKMQSADNSEKSGIELDKEFIYRLFLLVKRLNELISEQEIKLKLDTYIRLLKGLMRNITIPFIGEPLQGIQIMGILESRVLDFENVIILSMNEGILPKTETASSYIPFNMRKGFNMPVIEHQDAMYAYYFYRIIQRAKNVTLVYSEAGDEMSKGEMSRFLFQLKYENTLKIKERSLVFDVNNNTPKNINIYKINNVEEKLNKYLNNKEKSFSPSALNTYIDCSLKFYFRYIAKIYPQDDVKEDIDPAIFGLLVHKAMNEIYKSFVNNVINKNDIDKILNNKKLINSAINFAVNEELKKTNENSIKSGANLIIHDIIYRYIQNILKQDIKYTPFTIIGLEKEYSYKFPVSENNNYVNIKGTIDRIDKIGNEIRIIDYKTGSDNLEFKGIYSLFEKNNEKRNSAALQTFIYSYCFKENSDSEYKVVPGLYFIRSMQKKEFDYHLKDTKIKSIVENSDIYKEEFDTGLKELFTELFSKEKSFSQTENQDICKYCDYKKICNK